MSKTVKINIDGVDVKAPEGMNLIDAAELAGIHIPNLCYLKGMKGVGACRLCLVEVEGGRGHAVACNTKVKDGMVVKTKTPEIEEARKFVIDLIVSMHPLDCMTCTKAGVCNLQRYAYEFDMQESSFKRKRFGHAVDVGNPFIKMSPDYCILCGKCVRVCKEQGTNVLEFMGRGVGSKVTTVVDRSLQESDCTFCGSCVDACPVNAIIEADRSRRGREWEYNKSEAVCLMCGNACDLVVSEKDGKVQRVNAGAERGSAMRYICAFGRFGFDFLNTESRITTPMVRKGNKLEEVSWKEALQVVADNLSKAGKDAGFISNASIYNEDALTLKNFAEKVVKTKNYDSTMSLYADTDSLAKSESASIADADVIVLAGINPSQRLRILPMLNVAVRRRVARGAKLIVINSDESKLDKVATVKLGGDEVESIRALIKGTIEKGAKADKDLSDAVKDANVTEDTASAAEILAGASNPIIYTSPALFDAASNISLLKGHTLTVAYESNAKGMALMGMAGKGKSYKEMATGGAKALYIMGSVPINERPDTDFLIVQDSHFNAAAKHADVFLPATTYFESDGSIVDFKGRLKSIPKIIEPMGDSLSHREILLKLSKLMGGDIKKPKDSEIKSKVKKPAKNTLTPFKKKEHISVLPELIIDSLHESLFSSPKLFWLKETEATTASK